MVSGKQPARNALSRSVMMCTHRLYPLTVLHAGDITGLDDIARRVGWRCLHHRTDRPAEAALLALYTALAPEAR